MSMLHKVEGSAGHVLGHLQTVPILRVSGPHPQPLKSQHTLIRPGVDQQAPCVQLCVTCIVLKVSFSFIF